MLHGDCTRNAAWKYVSGDFRLRSIRMDDHCGTVTPVVSLPHDSVIVLVSNPLPMALRTGGSASSPIPADAPVLSGLAPISSQGTTYCCYWQRSTTLSCIDCVPI